MVDGTEREHRVSLQPASSFLGEADSRWPGPWQDAWATRYTGPGLPLQSAVMTPKD